MNNEMVFIESRRTKFVKYDEIFKSFNQYHEIYRDIASNMLRNSRDMIFKVNIKIDQFMFSMNGVHNTDTLYALLEYSNYQIDSTMNNVLDDIKRVCNNNIDGIWTYNTFFDELNEHDILRLKSAPYNPFKPYTDFNITTHIHIFFDRNEDLKTFEKLYILPLQMRK